MSKTEKNIKKTKNEESNLLTVKEAAKYLKLSSSMIYKLIKKKKIPFTKIESKYLFSKVKLDEWVDSLTNEQ
jgi:excisionase family DNA binding protein